MRILLVLLAFAVIVFTVLASRPEEKLPPIDGVEVKVNTRNFRQEVTESKIPVIVDCYATWCGPCKAMEPALAHLSVDYQGALKVCKLDVDQNPSLARGLSVKAMPTLLLYDKGELIDRKVGYMRLREIKAWVTSQVSLAPSTQTSTAAR